MTDYLQISTNFIPIPSAPKSQNANNQYNNSLQIINPQLTLHDLLISLDSNNLSHNNNKYYANITNSNSVNNLHYKYCHKITSSPYINQQPQPQQQQTKSIQKFYKNITNNKYDNKYDNDSDQQIFEIINQNKLLQLQMQQLMQQLNSQSKITQNIISQMNTNNNVLIQYRNKCYHYQQIQNQINKYRSEQLASKQYSINNINNINNNNHFNGNLDKQQSKQQYKTATITNRVRTSPGITIPSRQSSMDKYQQTPIININLNRAMNLSTKDIDNHTPANHKQQQHTSINNIKKDLNNLKYKLNNPYTSKPTNPNPNNNSNYTSINNTNNSTNLSTKQYNSKSTKNTTQNNQLDQQLAFIYDNNQPQHKQSYNNFNIHVFNKSISTDDSFQQLFKKTIPVSMQNKSTQLLRKINQPVPKNMYKKITPTSSWNNNNYIGCIDQNKSYLRKKLSQKCPNTVPIPQKNKISSKCSTPSKNQSVLQNYSYKADQNKYRKTKIFTQNKPAFNAYQADKRNQRYKVTAFKIDVRACK